MAFRLAFWRRPKPETAGRHVRATALAVPDSTGALAAPSQPDDSLTGRDIVTEPRVAAPQPVVPVARDSEEPQRVPGAPQSGPVEPQQADPGSPDVLPVAEPGVPSAPDVAAVALGFADGASVQLHPDDPRVTSFRAAAAALLDAPKA